MTTLSLPVSTSAGMIFVPELPNQLTFGVKTVEKYLRDVTVLAWTTMFGPGRLVSGHIASKAVTEFAESLGRRAGAMLRELKLHVRIPEQEIGYLLGAVIAGAGFQMLAGANGDDLEGAYAAAWLGIMALAE